MADGASAKTFGDLLKRHRLARGLSQEVLAERARMSVDAVGALERGTRRAPYRDTFELLADALGLSAEDRAELDAVAAQARRRAPRHDAVPKVRHNLPTRLTSFIGREEELAEITSLLKTHRIVTLTGSGGVGKTRVAVEAAKQLLGEHYDEAWFVDLAPVDNGAFVTGTIANVLDAPVTQAPDPIRALASWLKSRRLLLLLDNCEHLITEAAEAAAVIAHACPNVAVLATSRERLAIEGERVYRLPSLPIPSSPPKSADEALSYAALRLLVDRADAIGANTVFTPERLRAGAAICQQLEGIPLAIEIAATRVAALGVEAVQKHLNDHLIVAEGARDLPQRQRTMLATIAWSYALLSDQERLFLRRFAIFRGGATMDAIAAVIADVVLPSDAVPHILSLLVDKSLVSTVATNESPRYTVLESVRSFALTKLGEATEFEPIARAHASWLAFEAERSDRAYREMPHSRWLNEHAVEIDNIRAALEWATQTGTNADLLLAARIVGGFRVLWIGGLRYAECGRWLSAILPRIDSERYPHIAVPLMAAKIQISSPSDVIATGPEAIALFERAGERTLLAFLHGQIAIEQSNCGNFAAAEHSIERAFAIAEELQLQGSRKYADLLEQRCMVRIRTGRAGDARSDLSEVVRLLSADPDNYRLRNLEGQIEFVDGNFAPCVAHLIDAVGLCRAQTANPLEPLALLTAAYVALGDIEAAAVKGREALALQRFEPDLKWNDALCHVAAVIALRGHAADAVRLAGLAAAMSAATDPDTNHFFRSSREILMSSVRASLSDERIRALTSEGAKLDPDVAIDLALSLCS